MTYLALQGQHDPNWEAVMYLLSETNREYDSDNDKQTTGNRSRMQLEESLKQHIGQANDNRIRYYRPKLHYDFLQKVSYH